MRDFGRLSRADVAYAGGKGANLGELTAAGLPVPPGFVIGAPAYAAFCDRAACASGSQQRLSGVDVEDTGELERAAEEIASDDRDRSRCPSGSPRRSAMPTAELGEGDPEVAVAVRSSATAEDTESASFAGMNETMLNVRGADAVLDAVRRCWSSLFGARTHLLPRANGASARPTWTSRSSSSARSRRPAPASCSRSTPPPGPRDRLVIEGAFGLGESVVSGSVSPDRYVVGKDEPDDRGARDPPQGAGDRAGPATAARPPAS